MAASGPRPDARVRVYQRAKPGTASYRGWSDALTNAIGGMAARRLVLTIALDKGNRCWGNGEVEDATNGEAVDSGAPFQHSRHGRQKDLHRAPLPHPVG